MGYSAAQDVTDLTGSELDATIIGRLIDKADNRIKRALSREGLATTFGTTPDNIKEASAHFAAALVLRRHMVDGTLPSSQNIDGASASVNVEKVIEDLEKEGEGYLNEYIQKTAGAVPLVRVVGREGERVGEYETMTEAQEEET